MQDFASQNSPFSCRVLLWPRSKAVLGRDDAAFRTPVCIATVSIYQSLTTDRIGIGRSLLISRGPNTHLQLCRVSLLNVLQWTGLRGNVVSFQALSRSREGRPARLVGLLTSAFKPWSSENGQFSHTRLSDLVCGWRKNRNAACTHWLSLGICAEMDSPNWRQTQTSPVVSLLMRVIPRNILQLVVCAMDIAQSSISAACKDTKKFAPAAYTCVEISVKSWPDDV